MPNVTFILKNPGFNTLSPVLMTVTCHDGRLKYYTGEKAKGDNWMARVGKATRIQLNRITAHVEQLASDYKIAGTPLLKSTVKDSLDVLLHRKAGAVTGNYFTALESVITQMQSGDILTPGKKQYSAGTLKTFRMAVRNLQSFDPAMTAQSVTLDTYRRFIRWCHKRDYSTNFIGAQIKIWKTLGKHATGDKIYDDPEFRKIQEEAHDIYLDENELLALSRLKLNDRQALVRDWFILDCYTGLRVSDLVVLNKKNYNGKYITIANEKTDEKVVIPVHPNVRKVLDRHKGFPRRITDVEINRQIKLICEKAGITDNILHTITKGGRRQDSYQQKWEMVTCHTARRSFITNLRKNGVPDTIVMKLTGIRSAQTLKKYDKLSADEAAKIAAGLKFFK